MKKIILCAILLFSMAIPARAEDLLAPDPPKDAQELLEQEEKSFAESMWHVIISALEKISPDITNAIQICMTVIGAVLLTSMVNSFNGNIKSVAELVLTVALSTILLSGASALIHEGAQTITTISEYGKLFIPVMTAALAAQGGITTAGTIYAATAMFDVVITTLISSILIPMVYLYLAISIANCAIGEEILKKFKEFMKWLIGWSMKMLLYIFTGYVTITGVISGATDAAAMKATKLTISGMVPVVGGILSDASEAVLVGAGTIKNTIGISGMLAILAIIIVPFLRIGIHYLLLKLTGAVCSMFSTEKSTELIHDFSTAMGFLLGMTGTVCVMLFISAVCMMKGMNG